MTAPQNRPATATPVIVPVGRADDTLTAGLHSVGLAPVALDGEVVVWALPPQQPYPSSTGVLLTVADAAMALGESGDAIYQLIGRGELAATPVGGSSRVPRYGIDDLRRRRAGSPIANDGQPR
jgi:excisionase family DNA binding protein